MTLAAGGFTGVVVDTLLEMFEARAEHASQFLGEDDLVLQVQRVAFDVFEEVRAGACAVGFRLAVDRLVNVDGVGAAGNGRDPFVLAVVLVFTADQQFVLQGAGVEKTAQFELGNAVVPVVVALAIAAVDGVAIGIQRARLRGETPKFAFLVVAGQTQLPTVVELMFEGGLQLVVVVVDVAVVGFAEKGRTGNTAPGVVRRDDAAIEGRAVANELAFYQQACVGIELPTESGRDEHPLAVDVIAEAVVVLDGQVDPRQYVAVVIQRRVDVQGRAVAVPTAGAGLQGGEGYGLRLFGDDIDGATRITSTIKAGCRPLEHFDAFDIGHVRRARIATVGAESVLVELRRGEAAHAVLVQRQAAEVVLLRHAAGKLQRAFDAGAAQVVEHADGNYADRLRDVANGGVGFGRAGGAGCAIAIDRAGGGFVVGRDADGVQFQGSGILGEDRIPQQPEGKTCHGGLYSRRHVMLFQLLELKQYNMPNENVC
ncbi:hypothetical protein D3C87_1203890 [compost metagenome]